jgi:hypothetical protein
MRRVLFAVLGLAGLLIAGCSSAVAGVPRPAASPGDDRELVQAYFEELNDTAEEGPDEQRKFLRASQHPDYADDLCDLGPRRGAPARPGLRARRVRQHPAGRRAAR